MYGTDIDLLNYHHAVHNVSINQWDDRITLVQTKSEGPLIPLDTLKVDHLNFTMCNPPFFATKSEALATFSKDEQPFAACTGADVEMITPGGEVAYIRRMMEESLVLRDKVQWYTVQLGKWISLVELVKLLRSTFHCSNWVVNVLQPSGQTVRWVLGWSWMPYRATDVLARHKSLVGANLILEPNEMTLIASTPHDPRDWVRDTLQALPLDIRIVDNFEGSSMVQSNFIVRTDSAVWSRNARRKREREERSGVESREIPDGQIWPNIFTVMVQKSKVSDQMTFSAHALWTKGEDRAMFESFCGMLKSKRVD
jgi:23S rRNA (adenine1618-N6)-methyltransferase